jgi:hypothetical protein
VIAGQLPTGRTVKEIIKFNWIKKITIYNVKKMFVAAGGIPEKFNLLRKMHSEAE